MKRPVPNNLRTLRLKKGLTQEQVADYLGFASTDRISRWEHGSMYPHVKNFIKLLELYEAQAEEIYGDDLPKTWRGKADKTNRPPILRPDGFGRMIQ